MDNAVNFKTLVNKFYKNIVSSNEVDDSNCHSHLNVVIKSLSNDLEKNSNYIYSFQPVCRFLDSCINNIPEEFYRFENSIRNIKPQLNWQINNNYKNIFSKDFFYNESFVEIIGPNGLLISPNVRVGLLLLGEEVFYPSHNHKALEFYSILSGKSMWQQNNDRFEQKEPGDNIFHDMWVPHAMETTGEPALALFSWSGAITDEAVPI